MRVSGDYDLPNDVQTNNENGAWLELGFIVHYRVVERNYINAAREIIMAWPCDTQSIRNFSLREMES